MSEFSIILDRPRFQSGEEVTGVVRLQLDQPLRARGVRIRLHGEEYTHVQEGKSQVFDRRPIIDDEIALVGEERLASFVEGLADAWDTILNRVEHAVIPAGEHEYRFAFLLPPGAPPTYDGSSAEVEYRLRACVDLPVWMDLRAEAPVRVDPAPETVGNSRPSSGQYPRPEGEGGFWKGIGAVIRPGVRATLLLPRSRYGAGETLEGELAVEETGGARIRGVELRLVALEEARAQTQTARLEREAASAQVPWQQEYQPGAVVPFQLPSPPGIIPTLLRPHFSVRWFVQARLDLAFAVDVTLAAPVTIVRAARS
jgi:hypothetical protein